MNYAQEGLEANEIDNSLTMTNAVLGAELDAHSNTAILLENALTREQILKERCDSLTLEQASAAKTITNLQSTITNLQIKLETGCEELSTWLNPLAEMLAGRIVATAAFETAIDAAMENLTDNAAFERTISDIVEDKIGNLDFEVRVR